MVGYELVVWREGTAMKSKDEGENVGGAQGKSSFKFKSKSRKEPRLPRVSR